MHFYSKKELLLLYSMSNEEGLSNTWAWILFIYSIRVNADGIVERKKLKSCKEIYKSLESLHSDSSDYNYHWLMFEAVIEEMPLYIGQDTILGLIARWRLKIGK